MEDAWKPETTRARYNYNWSFDEYGKPAVNFYIEKSHKREGYRWTHPVHEVLSYDGEESFITLDDMTVNHYPDQTKSRSSYLPLLELSVKEDPDDDRNMHYLGREYMFKGEWRKSIEILKKHLEMPSAVWNDERCASMRYIARSYKELQENENRIYQYVAKADNTGWETDSRGNFVEVFNIRTVCAKRLANICIRVMRAQGLRLTQQSVV